MCLFFLCVGLFPMTCPSLTKVEVQPPHMRQSLVHTRRSLPHLLKRLKVIMNTRRMRHMQPRQCQRVGVATREGDGTGKN